MKSITIIFITITLLIMPIIIAQEIKPGKAPDFSLKNYDGKDVRLSDFNGKIVVLEWFNYECPFVRYHYEKVSTMKDLAAKYKDKNVVWLAINSTGHQQKDKNWEFAQKNKVPYPILDDSSGVTGLAYKATNTPHIFIIDTEGNIAYKGAIDNAPMGNVTDKGKLVNYADLALEELTAGKKVTLTNTKPYGCSVKYKEPLF